MSCRRGFSCPHRLPSFVRWAQAWILLSPFGLLASLLNSRNVPYSTFRDIRVVPKSTPYRLFAISTCSHILIGEFFGVLSGAAASPNPNQRIRRRGEPAVNESQILAAFSECDRHPWKER